MAHALDRTGPPMLILAFVRWLAAAHPTEAVEVVAFRGGALEAELAAVVGAGSVRVVLEPREPWDHRSAPAPRVAALRSALADLAPVDANVLVSVAASHTLALLDGRVELGPIATWAVELGHDLRWVDEHPVLRSATSTWLAGSEASARQLAHRWGIDAPVVPEFVEPHRPASDQEAARRRAGLGAPGQRVILGAGIGTKRKGLDLFVEVAAGCRRRGIDGLAWHWIGGREDPLHGPVRQEVARLALPVSLHGPVADLPSYLEVGDVFVHPAREDAFPLVALHAVLAGTPVVAFAQTGGIHELLGPGFVGPAYPDIESMVDVVGALSSVDARQDLAAVQHAWVAERFVVDRAAPRLRRHMIDLARGSW